MTWLFKRLESKKIVWGRERREGEEKKDIYALSHFP
jgi:hypothetical protein